MWENSIKKIFRKVCLFFSFLLVFSTVTGPLKTQDVYAKKRTYKVTVIGNSLMRTGSQLKYLKQIGKLYNVDIKIFNQLHDGYELSDHVYNAKNNKLNIRNQLKKSDIVIFQEYGTHYQTTYKDIVNLQKYMKKSARSYYYMTEFDEGNTTLFRKLQK